MAILRDLRKTWVPLIRIASSSIADIVADWYFYDAIRKGDNADLEKYEIYLFIFFIVSAAMGGLTLISLLIRGCSNKEGQPTRFVKGLNRVLTLEILLEDIPQFVLTSLITIDKGLLTPTAAFNMTTSAFNFVFNIFEMCEPKDEAVEQGATATNGVPNGNAEAEVTGPSMAVTGTEYVSEA